MRQAIATKYHGPTDRLGSRVSAKADAGRVVLAWDYALSTEGNHRAAAEALARKLDWQGAWIGGGLPDQGYCFVLQDDQGGFVV